MNQENQNLLIRYLVPFKRRLALLALLLGGSITLQLVAPQVIRRFLDSAQAGEPAAFLLQIAAIFFVVVVSQKALSLISVYASEDLGWAATNRLRVDLAAHCLGLDMGFHKLRTPGELIERIDGDVGHLAETFSKLVVQVLGNAVLVLGIILLLGREGWLFGLVGVAYAVLVVSYMRLMQPTVTRTWAAARQASAELSSYVEERLSGTEDLRANGAETYVMARLYPLLAQVKRINIFLTILGGFTFHGSRLIYVAALVVTLGLAGRAYLLGQATIGTVYLLVAYVNLLEVPMTQIRREIDNLQRALASAGRIGEFFALQPAVQEQGTQSLPAAAPSVQFEHVSFAYQDRPAGNGATPAANALNDVSFELPAGQVLGVLGRTGSGKTTLTRLLFRLYDPDEGAICLAGQDIREVGLAELRRHVGLVTQDVQIFAATVRDNLTMFSNYAPQAIPIDDATLYEALDTLGLREWLDTLPAGLDTMLDAGGQGLSAGEAQLLALGRVFLRSPQLVILDEASSRLDPVTEARLERAVDRLLAGRTGIIIAHRLRTVQRADQILILEDGRVQAFGWRLALAANPDSRFAHLLRTGLEEVLA